MKTKTLMITLMAAVCTVGLSTGANAQVLKIQQESTAGNSQSVQSAQGGQTEPGKTRMYIAPGGGGGPDHSSRPRLGFHGHMIPGYGMRVDHVLYGTPAQQIGLERGDVLWRIDGRRILSRMDYDQALQQAAWYQGGWLTLTVRNVRYDMGMSSQQFVTVSVRVMGGYAVPVAGSSPGLPGYGLSLGNLP